MSTHLAGHAGLLAVARLLPRVPGLKYISGIYTSFHRFAFSEMTSAPQNSSKSCVNPARLRLQKEWQKLNIFCLSKLLLYL